MPSSLVSTPLEEIPKIHASLFAGFANGTGKLSSIQFRKNQLLQLGYAFHDNLDRWHDALAKDMGRPKFEANMSDVSAMLSEVSFAYKNLGGWTKATGPTNWSITWAPFSPTIRKEPVGVVFIITPFNFPIWTLGPLVGAIAAGCPALIKPSELTPATSSLMAEILPKYLDQDVYRIVNGGVEVATKVLELKWDHILYTGSGRVGRIVATAAARHLTPVTLELGGKSPVFIDPAMDLKVAARRILWGKFMNAGQTCIAPDYVLIPESIKDSFVKECQDVYNSFYPAGPRKSDSFGRIISEGHLNRLKRYLDETKGEIVFGGEAEHEDKYLAPTLVKNVSLDDSLMQDEIFGPVLPLVTVKDVKEAIQVVNKRDRPLALYIFSNNAGYRSQVLDSTLSGAAVVNDVLMQGGCQTIPFGGSGPSGSGSHKGKFSFDTFTHSRPTIRSPSWIDFIVGFRFPPYTTNKFKAMNRQLMPSLPARRPSPTGVTK
ncbi:NAD-aldehyde dehydrogenase [Gautieria morchelliformis]|nr:NAD-aldehyde dehydrogenase [Gautieria morchelliformis]